MHPRCYIPIYQFADGDPLPASFSEDGQGTMRGGEVFYSDRQPDNCTDWIFIQDLPYQQFPTTVPKERRILFLSEPPCVRKYSLHYLEQFGAVVSPYPLKDYSGTTIIHHPCLGWLAGNAPKNGDASRRRFGSLKDVREFQCEKTKDISIVSSLKTICPGHTQRIAFLEALRQHFGDRVDYYGRELAPIEDKLEAIAPYRYHIAIENSAMENYWTEKLTDAWIGWSLPLYFGDPSIQERIPDPNGIEVLDIDDIPSALTVVERVLAKDVYPSRLEAITACREWAIRESNLLEYACGLIAGADKATLGAPQVTDTVYTQEDIITALLLAEIERMRKEGTSEGVLIDNSISLKISCTPGSDDIYVTPL